MTLKQSGYSDSQIEALVVGPAGGLSFFRLVVCPGYKLIEYRLGDGSFCGLILEDELLNQSTIQYLERNGIPEIAWNNKLR